jgi:predicted MFS family arabinose efflux permease
MIYHKNDSFHLVAVIVVLMIFGVGMFTGWFISDYIHETHSFCEEKK